MIHKRGLTILSFNILIMEKEFNLCEILKGLEGIKLYSTTFGTVTLYRIDIKEQYPIVVDTFCGCENFTNNGKYHAEIGECTLFPSKDMRDWTKFERPIPLNTPIVCFDLDDKGYDGLKIRYYAGINKDKKHTVYYYNSIRDPNTNMKFSYDVMIKYKDFDPNNIEKSIKLYNIQK